MKHMSEFSSKYELKSNMMTPNVLYNNKEFEALSPDLKKKVIQQMKENCDENLLVKGSRDDKWSWSKSSINDWKVLSNGRKYTDYCFRLRVRNVSRIDLLEQIAGKTYDTVRPMSTF